MIIFKVINIKFFLISFFIGLLYIYYENDKKKVYIYPTLHNYNELEYRDKANNCFNYNIKEVKCPSKKTDIYTIPIQ